MPEITPPTYCPQFSQELSPCTASRYTALLIVPRSAQLAAHEAGAEEGTFRHCRDALPSARPAAAGDAHAARLLGRRGDGAGRDVRGRARIWPAVRAQVGASVGGALG